MQAYIPLNDMMLEKCIYDHLLNKKPSTVESFLSLKEYFATNYVDIDFVLMVKLIFTTTTF